MKMAKTGFWRPSLFWREGRWATKMNITFFFMGNEILNIFSSNNFFEENNIFEKMGKTIFFLRGGGTRPFYRRKDHLTLIRKKNKKLKNLHFYGCNVKGYGV